MMRPLRFLLRKEFTQIVRDRVILRMLFLMPLAQLLLLGNAATFEVKQARLHVVDQDGSAASRGMATRLAASGRFRLVGASASSALADDAMLGRQADAILVVPQGFARDLVRAGAASVHLVFNAEDGAAAGVMQAYAGRIIAAYAQELGAGIVPARRATWQRAAGSPPRPMLELRHRGWYNAELRYRDYMVPGILVVLVTMIGTLLTAMNIVREKEAGTLEQLNVTPVSRGTFIAAKLIPLWSLAMVVFCIGLALAFFAFDVPVRGSIGLVLVATAIYLLGALGIGLWVSTIAETQQQAMFVTFAIMMIYLLMSGLFTPVRGMPEWAQWIAELSPVMHFIALMRAVLLKGAGVADVWRELAMLGGIGAAVLTLAVARYRKTEN